MSMVLNVNVVIAYECTIELSDRHLQVMRDHGVDLESQSAVGDFYRNHMGQDLDGVWLWDAFQIADCQHTAEVVETDEWWAEGELPERFWDSEPDEEGQE